MKMSEARADTENGVYINQLQPGAIHKIRKQQ